jgi:hypothetical protein
MHRPVRPVALVILTLCALYPGLTLVFQGLYPLVTGEMFNLLNHQGMMVDVARQMGLPVWVPLAVKTGVGLAWLGGVPGLWAGDWRAYPLVLLAAVGSLLIPGGTGFFSGVQLMGLIGLICLTVFRETSQHQPA